MRILQKISWEEGNYAVVWADVGEDLRAESDYLFLGKHVDYRLDVSRRHCVICGKSANSWQKTKEAYCEEHARERLNLCVRNGVANVNPTCTPESPACERFTLECGPLYVLYLAVGSLNRNIKVGITKEKRIYERAAEQGATALLPLYHQDGYPFFLHHAQLLESFLSGIRFGQGSGDYVKEFFLPAPGKSLKEVFPFLLSSPEKAEERLIKNQSTILKIARDRIKSRFGANSLEYDLISHLEAPDVAIKPDYTNFVDASLLSSSSNISSGSFECMSGNVVAVKGEVLLLKSQRSLTVHKLSNAIGFAQDEKRKQLKLSECIGGTLYGNQRNSPR